MFDVHLDVVLKIYLEILICICKFSFMVQLFVYALSFLFLWKNEKVKEIDWLGWEEKRDCNEGSGEQKSDEEEVSWTKIRYRNWPAQRKWRGKCLNTKRRRGLDTGDFGGAKELGCLCK